MFTQYEGNIVSDDIRWDKLDDYEMGAAERLQLVD
jgi:hypothetical protein